MFLCGIHNNCKLFFSIKEKSELQNKLYDVQRRLEECQSIIQCEREKETIAQQYQEEDNAEYKIQLLEAQEMERQRIARDLHDSTVQDLTSMLHKIELSMRVMDMDSQRCKMELSNVLDNIRNVISNTRKMIYNLRPMSVDDIGIDVTLKHAIAKIEQEWNRKIEYIIHMSQAKTKQYIPGGLIYQSDHQSA